MLGRVPQSVVDDEDSGLQTALEASLELRSLHRVSDNAQQQYVRSRPAPSPESIKRAKELDLTGLGLHPLFSEILQGGAGEGGLAPPSPPCPHTLPLPSGSRFEEGELQRLQLVDSIRNYRTRTVSLPDVSHWLWWPLVDPPHTPVPERSFDHHSRQIDLPRPEEPSIPNLDLPYLFTPGFPWAGICCVVHVQRQGEPSQVASNTNSHRVAQRNQGFQSQVHLV